MRAMHERQVRDEQANGGVEKVSMEKFSTPISEMWVNIEFIARAGFFCVVRVHCMALLVFARVNRIRRDCNVWQKWQRFDNAQVMATLERPATKKKRNAALSSSSESAVPDVRKVKW